MVQQADDKFLPSEENVETGWKAFGIPETFCRTITAGDSVSGEKPRVRIAVYTAKWLALSCDWGTAFVAAPG